MNIFKAFKNNITHFITKYFNENNIVHVENQEFSNPQPEFVENIFNYKYLCYEDIMNNFVFENKDEFSNFHEFSDYKILPEQFEAFYQKIILLNELIPEEQIKILNKIWLDSYFIYKALEPLQKLDIPFNLDLIGGSVRDLLLKKDIKDLDICVGIDMFTLFENKGLQFVQRKDSPQFLEKIKTLFSKVELETVNLNDSLVSIDNISKITLMCMNRLQDINSSKIFNDCERFIPQPDSNYGPEMINHLSALIKMGTKNTHYPVDLLVTDTMRSSLMNKVDFNICKVGMCLVNQPDVYSEKVSFPTSPATLMKRIYSDANFWLDAYNKKITFDLKDKKIEQIMFSLDERLLRITEKYPEYEVRISDPSYALYKDAQSILFCNQLNEKVSDQAVPTTKVKRKKI